MSDDDNENGTTGRALSLEELIREVDALRTAGKLPTGVTREQRISFVYGNCVLANPLVTREMVEAAVDGVPYRPTLYLPPMTHGDARYADGRRAGLLEAAEHLDAMGRNYYLVERTYRAAADELRTMAGEP